MSTSAKEISRAGNRVNVGVVVAGKITYSRYFDDVEWDLTPKKCIALMADFLSKQVAPPSTVIPGSPVTVTATDPEIATELAKLPTNRRL